MLFRYGTIKCLQSEIAPCLARCAVTDTWQLFWHFIRNFLQGQVNSGDTNPPSWSCCVSSQPCVRLCCSQTHLQGLGWGSQMPVESFVPACPILPTGQGCDPHKTLQALPHHSSKASSRQHITDSCVYKLVWIAAPCLIPPCSLQGRGWSSSLAALAGCRPQCCVQLC